MVTLSAYASGYRRLYYDDEAEIRASSGENRSELRRHDPENPALYWWPSTLDFRMEARHHGQPVPTGTFQELVDAVHRTRGSLTGIHWFGHGAGSGELQFGQSSFALSSISRLRNADLSARVAPNAAITFFACNAGQDFPFLQALADALRVRVRGFRVGVRWGLRFVGHPPQRRIVDRGLGRAVPAPSGEQRFIVDHVLPSPTVEAFPRG